MPRLAYILSFVFLLLTAACWIPAAAAHMAQAMDNAFTNAAKDAMHVRTTQFIVFASYSAQARAHYSCHARACGIQALEALVRGKSARKHAPVDHIATLKSSLHSAPVQMPHAQSVGNAVEAICDRTASALCQQPDAWTRGGRRLSRQRQSSAISSGQSPLPAIEAPEMRPLLADSNEYANVSRLAARCSVQGSALTRVIFVQLE